MADLPLFEHHASLYLEDGNVCLVSGLPDSSSPQTVFRGVHKSFLARHSLVFRDLFTLPTDAGTQDQYEGLPLVIMQDRTNEIESLLLTLYDR